MGDEAPMRRPVASRIMAPRSVRCARKLRSAEGQAIYRKRAGLVEPVFGTLKEQRQGRKFRLRGLNKVSMEFCLMALAYNVTRLHHLSLNLS